MNYVSAKEVSQNRESFCIVDIREPYEFAFCNIQTINIPMAEVCERLEELPKDKPLILMCKSGNRAEAIANLLITEFGIENLSVLLGGITAWKEEVDNSLILE